jgi:hypothetical protein
MKARPVATGDCNNCGFWKCAGSSIPGHLIPGGYGKCTQQPKLSCKPDKIRAKKTFTEMGK